MTTKHFDKTHVAAWERALRDKKPAQIKVEDIRACPEAESLDVAAGGAVFALRLATRDQQTLDVIMNPVVARALLLNISHAGRKLGWFDDNMNIIFPDHFFDG
nr:hypothetical protein [uncultured Cohaesibacter sp.]